MANKRLIDVNALLEKISEVCKEHFCFRSYQYVREFVGDISDAVRKAPTVDAVEVVHAEWLDGYGVYGGIKKYESIDCSNCGDYFKIESHDREYWKKRFKVCPFCGAVMDGERKDNG